MSTAEIPIELNTTGFVQGLKDVNEASKKSGATFREAFMGDVVGQGLDKLKAHLTGTAAAMTDLVGTAAKGLLAGGPVGMGIALLGTAVGAVADHFGEVKKAAAAAAATIAADFAASERVIADFTAQIEKSNRQIGAIAKARREGTSVTQALGGMDANDAKNALVTAQGVADATTRRVTELNAELEKIDREWRERIRAGTARDDRDAAREELARLTAIQPEQENAVLGARARLTAAERQMQVDAAEKEFEAKTAVVKKTATHEKQIRADAGADMLVAQQDFVDGLIREAARAQVEIDRIAANALLDKEESDAKFFDSVDETNAKIRKTAENAAADKADADAEFFAQYERDTAAKKALDDEATQNSIENTKKKEDAEKALRDQIAGAAIDSGADLARMFFAEEEKTKKQYEEAAKRALVEAAIQTAAGFAYLATGNPASATAAFISAGKYALIAGGSAIAGASASNSERGGSTSGNTKPSNGGNARGKSGGSGGGGNVTIVMPPGGLFLTHGDAARGLDAALKTAERLR